MNKEEGIEAIKRHLEAIENIAKELGESYLSLCILNDHISFSNGPSEGRTAEEQIHVCRIEGEWFQYHLS